MPSSFRPRLLLVSLKPLLRIANSKTRAVALAIIRGRIIKMVAVIQAAKKPEDPKIGTEMLHHFYPLNLSISQDCKVSNARNQLDEI